MDIKFLLYFYTYHYSMKSSKLKLITEGWHKKYHLYDSDVKWKLIIRGHIRDAFQNKDFYDLIKSLHVCMSNMSIYIHTWNHYSSSISWRNINENTNIVTRQVILDYFGDMQHLIQYIQIDDDKKINICGNLEGHVALSKAPILGWKNYWYGKREISQYLFNQDPDNEEMVINTRFDVLDCPSLKVNVPLVIEFVKSQVNLNFTKLNFVKDCTFIGLDNLYASKIKYMYEIANHFCKNLDDILLCYPEMKIQEHLVFYENDRLFS